MTIKQEVKKEIILRADLKGVKRLTIRKIAKSASLDYNGLVAWVNGDERSMTDKNIDKVISVLGKRVVLIDE